MDQPISIGARLSVRASKLCADGSGTGPEARTRQDESAQATDTAKASVEKAAPAPAKTPEEQKAAAELDQKIIDEGKANNEIMKNLQHLCYVIGPRLTARLLSKRQ